MLSSVRSFRSSTASLVLSSFSLSFVFPFTLCSFTVFLSRLPSSVPSATNSIRQSEPQEIGGAREFHRRICVLPPFLRSLPPTTILTPASSSFATRSFHLCLLISFSHCFSVSTVRLRFYFSDRSRYVRSVDCSTRRRSFLSRNRVVFLLVAVRLGRKNGAENEKFMQRGREYEARNHGARAQQQQQQQQQR